MPGHKGKPSGKYAQNKSDPGRKGEFKRTGWPEDEPTEHVSSGRGQQQGKRRPIDQENFPQTGQGRDQKAGSPH